MSDQKIAYFERRAAEELAAAERAACREAAEAHRELARRFRKRAAEPGLAKAEPPISASPR